MKAAEDAIKETEDYGTLFLQTDERQKYAPITQNKHAMVLFSRINKLAMIY